MKDKKKSRFFAQQHPSDSPAHYGCNCYCNYSMQTTVPSAFQHRYFLGELFKHKRKDSVRSRTPNKDRTTRMSYNHTALLAAQQATAAVIDGSDELNDGLNGDSIDGDGAELHEAHEQSLALSFIASGFPGAGGPTGEEDDIAQVTTLDVAQIATHGTDSTIVVGDTCGRVTVYSSRSGTVRTCSGLETPTSSVVNSSASTSHRGHSMRFGHRAFASGLDVTNTTHVDSKVIRVKMLPSYVSPNAPTYLAANARTVKLFRMRQDSCVWEGRNGRQTLAPTHIYTSKSTHKAPIHSLSLCADGETFLTCDDFQLTWWQLERDSGGPGGRGKDSSDDNFASGNANENENGGAGVGSLGNGGNCYRIDDVIPEDMENITQVFTTAAFHPMHASLFLVGSSDCWVGVGDLRHPPSRRPRLYNTKFTLKAHHNPPGCHHNEILCSPSDVSFLGPYHVVTRDYLTVKLWDMRQATDPLTSTTVFEGAIPYLDHLYDNDAIFDHFTMAVDQATGTIVTGLYGGSIAVWNPLSGGSKDSNFNSNHSVYSSLNESAVCEKDDDKEKENNKDQGLSHEREISDDHTINASQVQRSQLPWPQAGTEEFNSFLELRIKVCSVTDGAESIVYGAGDTLCVLNRRT